MIAGFLIFLPLVGLSILIDSWYYGKGEIVITALNFYKINVAEGLSNYFGVSPSHYYFTALMPAIFTVVYPGVLAGMF